MSLIDNNQYLTWNDSHCFRSRVLQLWEELLPRFPEIQWYGKFDGQSLNFSTKAKQALGSHFEDLMLLVEVQRQRGKIERLYIVDSLRFRYLKSIDPYADCFQYPTHYFASALNISLDWAFAYLLIWVETTRMQSAMIYCTLIRAFTKPWKHPTISHIWHGTNPNEWTLDQERRYFTWIVDNDHISSQDVLFILPQMAKRSARPDLYSGEYQVYTLLALYRKVNISDLVGSLWALSISVYQLLFSFPPRLPNLEKAQYCTKISRMAPLVKHFRPKSFVISMSQLGTEDPALLYMNQINIQTIMYSYSANCYIFGDEACLCDFRNMTFTNMIVSRFLVWHWDFKEYILQHPQNKTKVEVIGPLMAGNEDVIFVSPKERLAQIGTYHFEDPKALRLLSVFDMAAVTNPSKYGYPDPYTEEYALAFLRDIIRLLEDFSDIALIFKPQRSLTRSTFRYQPEFHELLSLLNNNSRGTVLDDDINPWLPIAISDLSISMPFTSPSLAALHHGIPGLFHDPTGIAIHHRYESISQSITHNYDELQKKVSLLSVKHSWYNGAAQGLESELVKFLGDCPRSSSSVKFRKLLREVAIDRSNHDLS